MNNAPSQNPGSDPDRASPSAQDQTVDTPLLRGVMDQALGFTALCLADGTIELVDKDALGRGGTTLEAVRGLPFWDGPWWAHDELAREWVRDACLAAAQGTGSRREIRARLGDGSLLWIDFQIAPIRDADGVIRHIVPSGIDISGSQEKQTRIDVLLGEVNHRTKNLLAIVQSVSRQIAAHADPEDAPREIARRIGSLSATQDLIIDANWIAVDLARLARVQLQEFGDLPSDLVELDGEPVQLTPQAAQTLGLALYELGHNGSGRVERKAEPRRFRLRWTAADARFRLTWTEIDGQMAPRPPLGSFSGLVLDQMTSAALGGTTGWDSSDLERCWTLDCPISQIIVSDSIEID